MQGRLQEGRSGGELGRESLRHETVEGDYRKVGVEGNWGGKVRDTRQWREITGRWEWRGTGEGKAETEDGGGRLQEGGSEGELERESRRQKTVEGDYRKVGVEGNWGGKVRDRRRWWEITGRWEWTGTGEGKSETRDSGGRLQEGGSGGELGRESQRHETVEGDYRKVGVEGNWGGKVRDTRQWRGTGEGKSETRDSGGRLQEGESGGKMGRGSWRQKTVEGDYRKVGVEGNWRGKVRDRRQWWEITGRQEWRGTGEGKAETEDSGGR